MRKRAAYLFLALIGFLGLFSGCAEKDGNCLAYEASFCSPYESAADRMFPACRVEENENVSVYYYMEKGNFCEAADVEALSMLQYHPELYWYPQYLATVVIAVDEDQTDAAISGWEDLQKAGCAVGFSEEHNFPRMMTAAISQGLSDSGYLTEAAVDWMEALAGHGLLKRGHMETPILICFDYQAVQMKLKGRNLRIVVPEEGTLCYQKGILSRTAVPFPEDMETLLLNAGMRLTDGRTKTGLYPDSDTYQRAAVVSDVAQFCKDTERFAIPFRREVFHIRLYTSADQIEHHLFAVIFIVLMILWLGLSMRSVLQPSIRRILLLSGGMAVGWVLTRYLKYQLLIESVLSRYCWYGYYFFQLGLPLCMLWLALSIDSTGKGYRILKRWLLGIYGVLMLAVLTNDLHMQVFAMDLSQPDWSSQYEYGPFYYVIFAASVLPIFVSVGLLIRKTWQGPKKFGIVFPILFGMLILFYGIGYVAGIPVVRDSDFTMVVCSNFLFYHAAAMLTGLIPVNHKYGFLFSHSPLKMQIVNSRGELQLASAGSIPVPKKVWERICASSYAPEKQDDDTLLYTDPIPGGAVVWQEDLRALSAMHREIAENVRRLAASNTLLSREWEAKAARIAAEEKIRLAGRLENEVQTELSALSRLVHALPEASDKRTATGKIAMLLCYIKRRCNLFFRERENFSFPPEDLVGYLAELSEFAEYAGLRLMTNCSLSAAFSPRQAVLFYEFFYAVLEACAESGRAYILVQLLQEGTEIGLKLLPSVPLSEKTIFGNPLRERIAAAGGRILMKELDDMLGVSLYFPEGGTLFD